MGKKITLRSLREKTGLSQKQFAEKLNVGGQFISNVERGVASIPPKHFVGISELCGVPVSKLVRIAVREFEQSLVEKLK